MFMNAAERCRLVHDAVPTQFVFTTQSSPRKAPKDRSFASSTHPAAQQGFYSIAVYTKHYLLKSTVHPAYT